jgi:hypothetical protein
MKLPSFLLCGLLLLLVSCIPYGRGNPTAPPPTTTAALAPPTPEPLQPSPSPTVPDPDWQLLKPGLEQRAIELTNQNGDLIETLHILRIDPAVYRFDVRYDPDSPRPITEWAAQTGARLVVNGSYFSVEGERVFANGLLVIDGVALGYSYGGFAGMLAVTHQGPELRWLAQQPYDPGEPLMSGLQSFPLLIKPGGELGFSAENEDNIMARRTAIGQDIHGRMLLMIAPQGYFTLYQLSHYLFESDLQLDIAMNLDGGPSSGLYLAPTSTSPPFEIPAYSPLPIVITVQER